MVERLDIVNIQVQENDNEETESALVNVSKTIAMSYCRELQLRVSQTSTSFPYPPVGRVGENPGNEVG